MAKPSAANLPAADQTTPAPQAAAEAQIPAAKKTLRVLLADDSEMLRRMMTLMLEQGGHAVVTVKNGQEAAEAALQQSFDVALLDMEMPVLDGMEAAVAIRKQEQNNARRLPIVALTARHAAKDREAYRAAGMDECLGKPFSVHELNSVLHRLCGHDIAPSAPELDTPSATAGGLMSSMLSKVNGDEKLLRSLLKTYRQEVPRRITAMQKALAHNDAATLARAAHALRGMLAMLGVTDAADIAGELEAIGRQGDLAQAGEKLHRVEESLQKVDDAIQLFAGGK